VENGDFVVYSYSNNPRNMLLINPPTGWVGKSGNCEVRKKSSSYIVVSPVLRAVELRQIQLYTCVSIVVTPTSKTRSIFLNKLYSRSSLYNGSSEQPEDHHSAAGGESIPPTRSARVTTGPETYRFIANVH
jgi:hypothetical protein